MILQLHLQLLYVLEAEAGRAWKGATCSIQFSKFDCLGLFLFVLIQLSHCYSQSSGWILEATTSKSVLGIHKQPSFWSIRKWRIEMLLKRRMYRRQSFLIGWGKNYCYLSFLRIYGKVNKLFFAVPFIILCSCRKGLYYLCAFLN